MALLLEAPAAPRVLVVEDDEILRMLLAASFDDEHVLVHAASSVRVRSELERFEPDVVVIGLGIASPRRFALLRELNRAIRSGAVGVTLVSGGAGGSVEAVVVAGDDVYLRTPFEPASILAMAGPS